MEFQADFTYLYLTLSDRKKLRGSKMDRLFKYLKSDLYTVFLFIHQQNCLDAFNRIAVLVCFSVCKRYTCKGIETDISSRLVQENAFVNLLSSYHAVPDPAAYFFFNSFFWKLPHNKFTVDLWISIKDSEAIIQSKFSKIKCYNVLRPVLGGITANLPRVK